MKKFSRKNIVLCLIAAGIVFIAVFSFFPRKPVSLLLQNKAVVADDGGPALILSLIKPFIGDSQNREILLTNEDYDDLLEELGDIRVRRKLFKKKSFSDQHVIDIYMRKTEKNETFYGIGTYYLSDNVLSIEGKQYKCYGDDLKEEILEILAKQQQ